MSLKKLELSDEALRVLNEQCEAQRVCNEMDKVLINHYTLKCNRVFFLTRNNHLHQHVTHAI